MNRWTGLFLEAAPSLRILACIWLGLEGLIIVSFSLSQADPEARIRLGPAFLPMIGITLLWTIYAVLALLRGSWWPVAIQVGGLSVGTIIILLDDSGGSLVPALYDVAIIVVALGLSIPARRRMNWSFFGKARRPSSSAADVFT